ncbi:hypothetical protein M5W96_18310 [Paenibacillus alvei]|nr:hypothetical protein [Paenibacillus alvei]MCY9581256.1 hypothetical protein [Paenibacillus alvei]MCY9584454.1 hypothetical protein [Paenibacillus alvei]
MKKIILIAALLLAAVVAFGIFVLAPERLSPDDPDGKTLYYTQINSNEAIKNKNGRYEYSLLAFDNQGSQNNWTLPPASKYARELIWSCIRQGSEVLPIGMKSDMTVFLRT